MEEEEDDDTTKGGGMIVKLLDAVRLMYRYDIALDVSVAPA